MTHGLGFSGLRIMNQKVVNQDPPCTLNRGYMVPNSGYLGPNRG